MNTTQTNVSHPKSRKGEPFAMPDGKTAQEEAKNPSEENIDVYTVIRMLEDRRGNLQFFGDSSNVSFVQLLRMIVETVYGGCNFALDPGRHQLTAGGDMTGSASSLNNILPDLETASVLVTAFFTNTFGVIEIFDEKIFRNQLEQSYKGSGNLGRAWQSHYYLVLTIGFRLATPMAGTREAGLVHQLRSNHPHRADEYFMAAQRLGDPLYDLDHVDFAAIQTLTLMALCLLYRADRNSAYLYTGTAVRLAYSHGLHREEVVSMFSWEERQARSKLWRTLFALDAFQSVSLGRPLAIGEREGTMILQHSTELDGQTEIPEEKLCRHGIEATIRACRAMRTTLRKVYIPRKISVGLAQTLCDENSDWPRQLPRNLHPQKASPKDVRQATAILHSNLANYHSILLLTRPFFVHLLSLEVQKRCLGRDIDLPKGYQEMQKLSNACIVSSIHTINILQKAFEDGYLPRVNLWPTYGIFGAALVMFANEIARPSHNSLVAKCLESSIAILEYCGEDDLLANRAANILQSFLEVLDTGSRQSSSFSPSSHSGQSSVSQATRSISESLTQASTPASRSTALPPPPADLGTTPTATEPVSDPMFASWAASDFSGQMGDAVFAGPLDLSSMIDPVANLPPLPTMDEDINFDGLFDWPAYDPSEDQPPQP